MKYLIIIEGFDPTSLPDTPTNAQLLQMVRQAQYADDIGGVIISETAPDVAVYDILKRFRWAKLYGSALTGEFYYHDGSSWVIEKPAAGTVTADSIADGTITLDKLAADGDPYDIIQINGAGTLVWTAVVDAILANSLPYSKLVNAAGPGYFFYSGSGGVWSTVNAHNAAGVILGTSGLTAATAFNSSDDIVPFRNAADDEAYGLTVANFFKSGLLALPSLTETTANDAVYVFDTSAALVKRVILSDLLPDTGVTAGAYSYPTSLTLNAKGQVTSIAATGSSTFLMALPTQSVPSAGAVATFAHGLTGVPSIVRVVLRCTTADANGYQIGDEISIENIGWSASNTGIPAFNVVADATNVTVISNNNTTSTNIFYYPKAGASAYVNFNTQIANWEVKVYVLR